MRHSATKAFWQKYQALSPEIQALADKHFSLLKANPQHPSLQFKNVGERSGQELWSARITLNYRALALKRPDIGPKRRTLKIPTASKMGSPRPLSSTFLANTDRIGNNQLDAQVAPCKAGTP